jgi:putative transposase
MVVDLVERGLQMAINIRKLKLELMFHSDRGAQYTSQRFNRLLIKYQITFSISSLGACLDDAVVENFFAV